MKRYGNLFPSIVDHANIVTAIRNAAKGKCNDEKDREGIIRHVLKNSEEYATRLHSLLVSGEYVCSEYKTFPKRERGKDRIIHVLPFYPDRILQHAILQILEPIWKSTLISHTFQSIEGRGVHLCLKHVKKAVHQDGMRYCLQIDVRKFYPSINNDELKRTVRKKIKCKLTLDLIDKIIDGMEGVPIGNYLSQYLANVFLSDLDHKIKEVIRIKYYYRYCDDLILLSNDKAELHDCLRFIEAELNLIGLELKGNYQIYEINDVRGVNCFGYTVHPDKVKLRRSIAQDFRNSLRESRLKGFFSEDMITSYFGWFYHCDGAALWDSITRGLWPPSSHQQQFLNRCRYVLETIRTERSGSTITTTPAR